MELDPAKVEKAFEGLQAYIQSLQKHRETAGAVTAQYQKDVEALRLAIENLQAKIKQFQD